MHPFIGSIDFHHGSYVILEVKCGVFLWVFFFAGIFFLRVKCGVYPLEHMTMI
jgi:hypothetical protein